MLAALLAISSRKTFTPATMTRNSVEASGIRLAKSFATTLSIIRAFPGHPMFRSKVGFIRLLNVWQRGGLSTRYSWAHGLGLESSVRASLRKQAIVLTVQK